MRVFSSKDYNLGSLKSQICNKAKTSTCACNILISDSPVPRIEIFKYQIKMFFFDWSGKIFFTTFCFFFPPFLQLLSPSLIFSVYYLILMFGNVFK